MKEKGTYDSFTVTSIPGSGEYNDPISLSPQSYSRILTTEFLYSRDGN